MIAIYDRLGNLQCKYVYDAWGNHKVYNASGSEIGAEVINIGNVNSIRYRGYYWDSEFSLYYLQSRYYDPAIGRFISPDDVSYLDPESIVGFNLYAYCNNDPVNLCDPSGHLAISTLLIGMAIGFGVGFSISGGFEVGKQINTNGWNPNDWDWGQIGLSALGGGLAGAISSISIGAGFVGYLSAFAFGGTASVVGGLISGSVDSWQTGLIAFGIGALANVIAYGASNILANAKASRIFNQGNKAKSLAVQKLQSHPLNMGSKALKGSYRNLFKQVIKKEIASLINKANPWFRYGIYSTLFSCGISGWY